MYVWDLVSLEGVDLRSLPLTERKARLKKLLRKVDGLYFVEHIQGNGPLVFDHPYRMGLEGIIISKLADSAHPEGSTRDWLKVKSPHYGREPINWRPQGG